MNTKHLLFSLMRVSLILCLFLITLPDSIFALSMAPPRIYLFLGADYAVTYDKLSLPASMLISDLSMETVSSGGLGVIGGMEYILGDIGSPRYSWFIGLVGSYTSAQFEDQHINLIGQEEGRFISGSYTVTGSCFALGPVLGAKYLPPFTRAFFIASTTFLFPFGTQMQEHIQVSSDNVAVADYPDFIYARANQILHRDHSDFFKSVLVGVNIGIGYPLRINRHWSLIPTLHYNTFLSSKGKGYTWKTSSVSLGFQVTFPPYYRPDESNDESNPLEYFRGY